MDDKSKIIKQVDGKGKEIIAPKSDAKENPDKEAETVEEETVEDITDLSQMSDPIGLNPFILISRDEHSNDLEATQIGTKGVLVAYKGGLCFIKEAKIQQAGENNCLA